MILDTNEHPIPPADIVERLKQIDPRLGLVFGETLDPKTENMIPAWGLSMDWLPTDPRHRLVQAGRLPLDGCWDVLCYLPGDCGVDEAYGFVVQTFKALSGGREDVRKLLERAHTFNAKRREEILAPVVELAEELIEANAGTLFRELGKTSPKFSAITHHPKESKASQAKKLREYMDQ